MRSNPLQVRAMKDAKLEPGDIVVDERGEQRVVERVWTPDEYAAMVEARQTIATTRGSSAAGACAMYGPRQRVTQSGPRLIGSAVADGGRGGCH